MSKLSSLIGKSQTCKIGDLELEIKPLRFENMDLLAELENPEKRIEAMREIIKMTLKEAVPDATDDEIEQIGISHLLEITKAIQKVNGLENVETKKN